MLVQEYLQHHSLDDLYHEHKVRVSLHPDFPLCILNYTPRSDKACPLARECRGLVLETGSWELVARAFPRFFNWGEMPEEQKQFCFSNFLVQHKEDGSFLLVYFYQGRWFVNTRSTFGEGLIYNHRHYTWHQVFLQACGLSALDELDKYLDRELTYVCELCSPYNRIVRYYEKPQVFLLTVFRGFQELPWEETRKLCPSIFQPVEQVAITSHQDALEYVKQKEQSDRTFEGLVLRDQNNFRLKLKNPGYLKLHDVLANEYGKLSKSRAFELFLQGEKGEVLSYFPEFKPVFDDLEQEIKDCVNQLESLWKQHHHLTDQKEFALKVKDHPLAPVLFHARKLSQEGQDVSLEDLLLGKYNQLLIRKWNSKPGDKS